MTNEQRKKLIEDFIPYANDLAKKKYYRTPRFVTVEELKSAAYLGLCDAASRAQSIEGFNPYIRIIGEMKNYLRSLNWKTISLEIEPEYKSKNDGDPVYLMNCIKNIVGENVANIFSLYCLENKNISEIAQIKGKSSGRISQIMKEARTRLKSSLLAA